MELHVLNGDALAEKFTVINTIIICREALIDGPVDADDEEDFWKARSKYISETFKSSDSEYEKRVVNEYRQLANTAVKEINLWFEHDLFCQTNLWFTIDFIRKHNDSSQLFMVSPDPADQTWDGFGSLTSADLHQLYAKRIQFSKHDIELSLALWEAYRKNDLNTLSRLSTKKSNCFPRLQEVCQAEEERHSPVGLSRPERKLKSIIDSGVKRFDSIFAKFQETEKLYGFGDSQVKRMLERLVK